jgi:hypothetical protein
MTAAASKLPTPTTTASATIILYHANENREGGATTSKYFNVRDFQFDGKLLQFVHQATDGKLEMICTNLMFKVILEIDNDEQQQLPTKLGPVSSRN